MTHESPVRPVPPRSTPYQETPAHKGPEGGTGRFAKGFDFTKPEAKRGVTIKTAPGQALGLIASMFSQRVRGTVDLTPGVTRQEIVDTILKAGKRDG